MKPAAKRDFTETTLESRTVYQGRLLRVKEDRVRLPDGGESGREYIEHPGAVIIIAELPDGKVLLERQFRYPLRDHVIELPAGKIEPGEPPLSTAQRELLEETGYLASDWRQLAQVYPCVGYSDERIVFFLARGLTHEGHQLDDGEFLEVMEVSLDEALSWVDAGRIADVKTIAGLLWLARLRYAATG